jgi:hypothetical protein
VLVGSLQRSSRTVPLRRELPPTSRLASSWKKLRWYESVLVVSDETRGSRQGEDRSSLCFVTSNLAECMAITSNNE